MVKNTLPFLLMLFSWPLVFFKLDVSSTSSTPALRLLSNPRERPYHALPREWRRDEGDESDGWRLISVGSMSAKGVLGSLFFSFRWGLEWSKILSLLVAFFFKEAKVAFYFDIFFFFSFSVPPSRLFLLILLILDLFFLWRLDNLNLSTRAMRLFSNSHGQPLWGPLRSSGTSRTAEDQTLGLMSVKRFSIWGSLVMITYTELKH